MDYYRQHSVLIQDKIPLQLQRSHWHKFHYWLGQYLIETKAKSTIEKLIQATLLQAFIKISKLIQRLERSGKPMKSKISLQLSPSEKYGLEYSIQAVAEEVDKDFEPFYLAYLQPILDQFHQHDINQPNQGLSLL
ncbi:hypothetical protein [Aureispira anguillae]|uniref:Uncharacterized protein n=1 Tax=Aureispira anguillae TaxID=2864201 RepID=A0A915YCK0_9BACT|nr:hypothetical protein [Aureispira anguillae]BDS10598.1 hypothetical protein AsAng_0013060 [Aureispira anguillae]